MALLEFVTLASTTDFKITLSFGELLKDIFMSVKFEVVFISPFEFTLWTIKSSLFIPSPNLIVSFAFALHYVFFVSTDKDIIPTISIY